MSNADHRRDSSSLPPDTDAAQAESQQRQPTTPQCPYCGSRDTESLSPFASQLSTSQYLCLTCHSPFELFTRGA